MLGTMGIEAFILTHCTEFSSSPEVEWIVEIYIKVQKITKPRININIAFQTYQRTYLKTPLQKEKPTISFHFIPLPARCNSTPPSLSSSSPPSSPSPSPIPSSHVAPSLARSYTRAAPRMLSSPDLSLSLLLSELVLCS